MINKKIDKFKYIKNFKKTLFNLKNMTKCLIFSEIFFKLKKKNFLLINKVRLRVFFKKEQKLIIKKKIKNNRIKDLKKKHLKKFFFKKVK